MTSTVDVKCGELEERVSSSVLSVTNQDKFKLMQKSNFLNAQTTLAWSYAQSGILVRRYVLAIPWYAICKYKCRGKLDPGYQSTSFLRRETQNCGQNSHEVRLEESVQRITSY